MASGRSVEGIPVTRLGNGHDVELVMHVIRGSKEGPKLAMLRAIGADETVDYTRTNFIEQGIQYDNTH